MALDTIIKTGGIGPAYIETRVNQMYLPITTVGPFNVLPAVVGKQIQITRIVLCTDTAATFNLASDTDPINSIIMVANGGYKEQAPDVRNPLYSTTAGAALNMMVSVAPANAHLYIHYRYI